MSKSYCCKAWQSWIESKNPAIDIANKTIWLYYDEEYANTPGNSGKRGMIYKYCLFCGAKL